MKKKTKEEKRIAAALANAKYYEKNKVKLRQRQKEWNEKNPEYIKEWNEKNKKEANKKHRQTEKGIKSNRISKWKFTGVKCDNWDVLYENYINCKKCENCGIELTEDKRITPTTRCLDHDHETGKFRNVLCHSCNRKRG